MANKVVLVTGAASGIGRATATVFAQHGYDVIINYIKEKDAANTLKQELENKYNINASVYQADISDESAVNAMIAGIVKKYGKIDALINNAGIVYDRAFANITIDEFKETLNVDVLGAFIVSRAAEPYMLGGGNCQRFFYKRHNNSITRMFRL